MEVTIGLAEADLLNGVSLSVAIIGSTKVVHVAPPFFYLNDESLLVLNVEGTIFVVRACREN